MLIENVARQKYEKRRGRKRNTTETETIFNLTPDDRDAKKRTTDICNFTLVYIVTRKLLV